MLHSIIYVHNGCDLKSLNQEAQEKNLELALKVWHDIVQP